MYHAASIEQIGKQMDRLLPIIAAALTRAAEEAVENDPDYQACCERREELQAQLQAAQPAWSDKRPSAPGGYWKRTEFGDEVVMIKEPLPGRFVVGTYKKPLEECADWQFSTQIPLPREASMMQHTKETLLKRRDQLICEIEQIFTDAEHWNLCVRASHEEPINPDPDGELRRMLSGLRKGQP